MDTQGHTFYRMRKRLNALNAQRNQLDLKLCLNTRELLKIVDQMPTGKKCNSQASLHTLEVLEKKYKNCKLARLGLMRNEAELQDQEMEALLGLERFRKPYYAEKLRKFIKENESLCRGYGKVKFYEESILFLESHPTLICEEAARFLIEWGLKLVKDQQSDLVNNVAHQSICLQYILELALQMKTSPVECIRIFFKNIRSPSPTYKKQFLKDYDILVEYINRCGVRQPIKNVDEKRCDDAILDPFTVIDSLPRDIRICFVQQNIKSLQDILLNKDSEATLQHLKRCIEVGIWDPKGNSEQSGRNVSQQGNQQRQPLPVIQLYPVDNSPDTSQKVKTNQWGPEGVSHDYGSHVRTSSKSRQTASSKLPKQEQATAMFPHNDRPYPKGSLDYGQKVRPNSSCREAPESKLSQQEQATAMFSHIDRTHPNVLLDFDQKIRPSERRRDGGASVLSKKEQPIAMVSHSGGTKLNESLDYGKKGRSTSRTREAPIPVQTKQVQATVLFSRSDRTHKNESLDYDQKKRRSERNSEGAASIVAKQEQPTAMVSHSGRTHPYVSHDFDQKMRPSEGKRDIAASVLRKQEQSIVMVSQSGRSNPNESLDYGQKEKSISKTREAPVTIVPKQKQAAAMLSHSDRTDHIESLDYDQTKRRSLGICEGAAPVQSEQQPTLVTPENYVFDLRASFIHGGDCRKAVNLLLADFKRATSGCAKSDRVEAPMQVQQQKQTFSEGDEKKMISKCNKAVQTEPGVFIPYPSNRPMSPLEATSSDEQLSDQYKLTETSQQSLNANQCILPNQEPSPSDQIITELKKRVNKFNLKKR